MPRLFSVLALAAAFIPAVLANETDCNVSRVGLMNTNPRGQVATISTDFETTRYDQPITGVQSDVAFEVFQNGNSNAGFYISLNGDRINTEPGNVENSIIEASGFNTACGAENLVLIEVTEVKADDAKRRYDSCNFKYEIHYQNPAC